jgi:phosphopantethiene--protein transferase domain
MSFSIGVDIIEIDRIKQSIDRYGQKFLDKIFTKREQEYCLRFKECERQFAGRFAAKEACVKALGTGITNQISWKDIEIVTDPKGKPIVVVTSNLDTVLQNERLEVSISHCKAYATAAAIKIPT